MNLSEINCNKKKPCAARGRCSLGCSSISERSLCKTKTGSLVFLFYMLQIFLMALLGIFLGLALGALTPLLANGLLASLLPFDLDMRLFPAPLAAATGFGLLTAIGFALNPLARAQAIPVASLFRDSLVTEKTSLPFWVMGLYASCLLGLVLISFLVVHVVVF